MTRPFGRDSEDRIIVVGGGIAGLATALGLAPVPVTVVTKAGLGTEASTCWAQGGIAAALGPTAPRACMRTTPWPRAPASAKRWWPDAPPVTLQPASKR